MSNTSKGRGVKGSKYWMQIVVEKDEMRKELENKIGDSLRWISPLAGEKEEFLEYELQHEVVRKEIGISDEMSKTVFSFWPSRQPQWDGLAISEDGRRLYMVEAKSHRNELRSNLSATSESSIQLIKDSMKEIHDEYYPEGDFNLWINGYYQLANRLTFLNQMKRIKTINIESTKLVLLNFVGDKTFGEDKTHKSTTEQEWIEHYKEVFKLVTGSEKVPEDVIFVNFNVL